MDSGISFTPVSTESFGVLIAPLYRSFPGLSWPSPFVSLPRESVETRFLHLGQTLFSL